MSSVSISIVQQSPPPGSSPRTLAFGGNVSIRGQAKRIFRNATIQVSIGGTIVNLSAVINTTQWSCAAEPPSNIPRNQAISVTADITGVFDVILVAGEEGDPEVVTNSASMTALTVGPPMPPELRLAAIASPIVTDDLPKTIRFSGTSTPHDAPMSLVQYMVDGGTSQQFPTVHDDGGNFTNWSVTLPVPPGVHSVMFRGMDRLGSTNVGGDLRQTVEVRRATSVPEGPKTLGGAATTASVTSWTRLEPQSSDADLGLSSRARVFDPLWMLARQWQMGEFQAEDAGSPVQVRVRATNSKLSRCQVGAIPSGSVQAPAYDPARTPLEALVERRRMRAADEQDPRMLVFAIDAGLHFLRMLELEALSKNYRAAFISRLAFQRPTPAPDTTFDDASDRYIRSMLGRAPDGRRLASLLRTIGAAQLVVDPALKVVAGDRAEVQDVATRWLAWYDSLYSEPTVNEEAWDPSRLEYSMSVAARLPGTVAEDLTLSAAEVDGSLLDWSSFDRNVTGKLGTSADQASTSIVIAAIPSPLNFPGAPAPRFWEMEDASVAYGLVPVGPTDIAHLLMIEYASSYGNDWFVVPATLPVGSITQVDSMVVTDSFGVRSLLRPIGDPALSQPYFSMWQTSDPDPQNARHVMTNHFFLAPTLSRTLDSAPTEEVHFLRDEMANVAWAIERSIESPIERATQRYEAQDAAVADPAPTATLSTLPRYLLSSTVPPNWIPLMPVQPTASSPKQSLLRRGTVLQPDGSGVVHHARGDLLTAVPDLLVYDEEVPREGVRITRQRRASRWIDGSTWVWTSLRNQVGSGEGSSALQFDQTLDQSPPR
jgi:hypothetical protein